MADIVGVVFPDLRRDAKVGTQERGAQFCDQLLAGIAEIAETLAAEITVETCCMACPMRELVKGCGIVAFLVLERLKRRELYAVGGGRVIGLIAAKMDGRAGGGDKLVSVRETVGERERNGRLRVVVRGKPVDLFDVEDGIPLHEGNFTVNVLAGAVGFSLDDAIGIDDK